MQVDEPSNGAIYTPYINSLIYFTSESVETSYAALLKMLKILRTLPPH